MKINIWTFRLDCDSDSDSDSFWFGLIWNDWNDEEFEIWFSRSIIWWKYIYDAMLCYAMLCYVMLCYIMFV